MRISPINMYNNQQKINQKKTNPNFGIKLNVDSSLQFFAQKEAINLAASEKKFAHYYVRGFLGSFLRGIHGLADILDTLEPKEMELKMGLTNSGMAYVNSPRIDGNLYRQLTDEKPVYLGFMNPKDPKSNLLAKPIDFPFTEVNAMENLEDIFNLVSVYKELSK